VLALPALAVLAVALAASGPALAAGLVPDAPARPGAQAAGACFSFSCAVSGAVTNFLSGLVKSAVKPLLALIGQGALSAPQPAAIPAVHALWLSSLAVADACYVLLVLAGAVVVMTHETVQASYSVREILPRIVLGFAGANLSMLVISRAITIANALSGALTGRAVTPAAAARSLLDTLGRSASDGGILLIALALAGVALALVLAMTFVLRIMAVILLAAAAPLAVALYALPQTSWAARWWWRALTAALAVQVAQALVLTAAVKVFFSPAWLPLADIGLPEHLLITLCLLYVLMRVPFWIARPVLSPLGSSPARRAARFAFTALVLSRIAPLLRGTPRPGGSTGAGPAGKKGTP
jgi:hypothetical protein